MILHFLLIRKVVKICQILTLPVKKQNHLYLLGVLNRLFTCLFTRLIKYRITNVAMSENLKN